MALAVVRLLRESPEPSSNRTSPGVTPASSRNWFNAARPASSEVCHGGALESRVISPTCASTVSASRFCDGFMNPRTTSRNGGENTVPSLIVARASRPSVSVGCKPDAAKLPAATPLPPSGHASPRAWPVTVMPCCASAIFNAPANHSAGCGTTKSRYLASPPAGNSPRTKTARLSSG